MRLTTTLIAVASAGVLVAGCGDSDNAKPTSTTKSAEHSQAPFGTYARQVTKADLQRTAKVRDEAGPNQETPPAGRYRLVIAKGASGPVLKVTDPTNFTVDMNLAVDQPGMLNATTYVNPRRATFCGPQIQESASYTFKRDGSALVLAASPQDPCADRDSILSGRWTSGA